MKNKVDIVTCANVARSFYLGSQRCFEMRSISPTQIEGLPIPAIVCAAFATELGMKALLFAQGNQERGHDLVALFGKLNPETQSKIVSEVGISHLEFPAELKKIANAFQEWRYVYESSSIQINPPFLVKLAKVLTDVSTERPNQTPEPTS